MKNHIKYNKKEIKKQKQSLDDLKNYLLKNDLLVSNDNMTRNRDIWVWCNKGPLLSYKYKLYVYPALNLYSHKFQCVKT